MKRGLGNPNASAVPRAHRWGDRRAFLRALVRYPAVAGMTVLGGWLALRRVEPGSVEPCIKRRVCRGCQLFAGCERPQAVATRQEI